MSQIYKSIASGPIPPAIPDQFTADDGTIGIPVANNLNILSRDTTEDNPNGIQTTVDPNNGDDFFVELTNRITGSLTTNDDTPQTLFSFDMGATAGTYVFFTRVTAFNVTDNISSGYASYRCVRTTGAAGILISAQSGLIAEEGAMSGASAINDISGNNAILTVEGLVGKEINWFALTEITFVGS